MRAQKRIAAGTREMLEQWMEGKPFKEENYIVREGKLASQVLPASAPVSEMAQPHQS